MFACCLATLPCPRRRPLRRGATPKTVSQEDTLGDAQATTHSRHQNNLQTRSSRHFDKLRHQLPSTTTDLSNTSSVQTRRHHLTHRLTLRATTLKTSDSPLLCHMNMILNCPLGRQAAGTGMEAQHFKRAAQPCAPSQGIYAE
jgi:hypothetical protein